MSAQGLMWVAGLPLLAGFVVLALDAVGPFRGQAKREGPPAMLLAGAALGLVMIAQLVQALWRTEVLRVVDPGVPWLGSFGLDGGLGFVAEPLTLVPAGASLVIALIVATRNADTDARRRGGAWASVAIGGGLLVVLSRTGIGVLAGWWLMGVAARRVRPGSETANALSDVAAAVAVFVAFDASGTFDLVAQRVASILPLREAWVGPLSRADFIVGGWVVAFGARALALSRGRTPDDPVAVATSLGAGLVLPWVALMLRLGPWIGSAPIVDAAGVTLSLLMVLTAVLRARWSDHPQTLVDALASVGPGFAAVLILSGGGFAAMELALVFACSLPALVATVTAGRRDLLGVVAALGVLGCAPLAGHLSTANVVLWIQAHDSAASPAVNSIGLGLVAVILAGAAVAVARLRHLGRADAELDHDTVMLRVGLALALGGLTYAAWPAVGGEPSGLLALVNADFLYGPEAVGEASAYFVGPRPDWVDPTGAIEAERVRRSQVWALIPAAVWVLVAWRGRGGVIQPLVPSRPLDRAAVRGLETLGAWPTRALQAIATSIDLVFVHGLAREGSRVWRTVLDRASGVVPRRVPAAPIVVLAIVVATLGWLYLKPSVATLGSTEVHGFGGLHHRMQPVADPTRDRKRASDEAREILDEAARRQAEAAAGGATPTELGR